VLKSLGFEKVRMYEASFAEWSNLDDAPMEK